MPNFTISLRDANNDVALSVVGTTIQISDYSNYIASTETNHLLSQFHAKAILVRELNSSDYYFFCSYPTAERDAPLSYPSSYTNPALYPPITTSYTFTYDAIHEVTLIAIPTFQKASVYAIGDCVALNGKVYESNSNANNTDPAAGSAAWDLIVDMDATTAVADLLTVNSKYLTTEYIAVVCSLEECFADLVYNVNCVELSVDCDDVKLCTNDNWRKQMRLSMILDSIQTLMDDSNYNQAQILINQGSTLCSCCS